MLVVIVAIAGAAASSAAAAAVAAGAAALEIVLGVFLSRSVPEAIFLLPWQDGRPLQGQILQVPCACARWKDGGNGAGGTSGKLCCLACSQCGWFPRSCV